MRKFRNNVSDGWLFAQELKSFRNFAWNWDRDVEEEDFFGIFGNPNNSSQYEAKRIVSRHFTLGELEKADVIRIHRAEDGEERGFDFLARTVEAICLIWNTRGWRERCREMLMDWCDVLEGRKTMKRGKKDPMEARMDEMCAALKLGAVERDVLTYAAVRALSCFDSFPRKCTKGRHDRDLYFAMATDRPCSAVVRSLAADATLRRYEVLNDEFELGRGNPFRQYLECGDGKLLEGNFYSKADLDEALPWSFYGKLAEEHGALLMDLISSAGGMRGANILLYGLPGTGKTSFAKALAKEMGRDLFEIRQGDRDGQRECAPVRITGIRICNERVTRGKSIIMVDEADELLETAGGFSILDGRRRLGGKKGILNTVLDEIKVPTIWICNAPAEAIDDSVRRRFDYSIRFERLDSAQRRTIWRNNVSKLKLGGMITEAMIESLADRYQTSAGGITMVLENVKRMKPGKAGVIKLIDRLMKPHCELMSAKTGDDRSLPAKDYSLEGLNIKGDIGLDRIVEAVRAFRAEKDDGLDPDSPRMNLLLWGPPGTGKTEFVKFLGKELNAKVSVKMGSDLLSMWVGGTEQNIKQAFDEAEEENSILFLDEIDGLVQDRCGARQRWEVTQVNELLHRMENFKGVMVGATNFMDNLDAAIMRRFTFKLEFGYLDDDGKKAFFERMFATHLSPADAKALCEVPNLAPGDFRTVRQSLHYLCGEVTNAQRISELAKESALKKDSKKGNRIGF